MKTLKFLTVLGVLAFFTFGNTNAQTQKEVYVHSAYLCFDQLPCIGETVCGELNFVETWWDGKYQCRISGTLVGTSGDVYTAFEIDNIITKKLEEGTTENYTFPTTCILKKKGAPAFALHWNTHYTINANGELTVSFDTFSANCL